MSGKNRQVFRTQIFEDWFFIPSYSLAFLGLIIVGFRKTPFGTGLAFSAVVCVALAAACDVQENLAILRVVNNGRFDPSDAPALAIRNPSMVKWAAIFAACAWSPPLSPPDDGRSPDPLARAGGGGLACRREPRRLLRPLQEPVDRARHGPHGPGFRPCVRPVADASRKSLGTARRSAGLSRSSISPLATVKKTWSCITLAPKKLIRTRRASEGSASEPSLARRVSMCKDAKLSYRGNRYLELATGDPP